MSTKAKLKNKNEAPLSTSTSSDEKEKPNLKKVKHKENLKKPNKKEEKYSSTSHSSSPSQKHNKRSSSASSSEDHHKKTHKKHHPKKHDSSSSSRSNSKDKSKRQSKKKIFSVSRLHDAVRQYFDDEEEKNDPIFNLKSLSIDQFREGIIGRNVLYESPFGGKIMTLYADDTASGRPHDVVENYIRSILPLYANTHSDNSYFPVSMHLIYKDAIKYFKEIFNAPKNYEVMGIGTGSTGAIFRFQEILMQKYGPLIKESKNPPICIVTEYEHHSNILSWYKYGFKVIPIKDTWLNKWKKGIKDLKLKLEDSLESPLIVVSTSAASNVTSQLTPLDKIAEVISEFKKNNNNKPPIVWSADLAALAPHRRVNMQELKLDAIFISPHKLTGGPGSSGILIFNKEHYDKNATPTHPAGGTVQFVYNYSPEDVIYATDVLERESAGTPGILQLIRAKEAFALQDKIGLKYIEDREHELKLKVFEKTKQMNEKWQKKGSGCRIDILGTDKADERSSVFAVVMFDDSGNRYHFHLMQRILNDIFGIQLRSGCNCAGPFGVKLLEDIFDLKDKQEKLLKEVKAGDFSKKPGWVRFNVHYSFTNYDMKYLLFALRFITENGSHIANNFYEESDGEYHISQIQKNTLNVTLNQLDAASVKRIKPKEIHESKREKYLKKTMEGVKKSFCEKNK